MKKIIAFLSALLIAFSLISCNQNTVENNAYDLPQIEQDTIDVQEQLSWIEESQVDPEAKVETKIEKKINETVYIAPTGKRYHYRSTCAGKNAMEVQLSQAENYYTPCKKCVH